MLYRDDVPNVEVGVLLDRACPTTGRVVSSTLPAGSAATAVHQGPYARLGAAHRAVLDWCAAAGRRPTGTRWEVYGPHTDEPPGPTTEVFWLLADEPQGARGIA
jgi:effector-binding domain-containing protein